MIRINKRCSVDGCTTTRGTSHRRCTARTSTLRRLRRTGTTDKPTIAKFGKKNDRGYVLVYELDHPFAGGKEDNYVYEHRQVLHDARGIPPVRCEWCLTDLDGWSAVHVDQAA